MCAGCAWQNDNAHDPMALRAEGFTAAKAIAALPWRQPTGSVAMLRWEQNGCTNTNETETRNPDDEIPKLLNTLGTA